MSGVLLVSEAWVTALPRACFSPVSLGAWKCVLKDLQSNKVKQMSRRINHCCGLMCGVLLM